MPVNNTKKIKRKKKKKEKRLKRKVEQFAAQNECNKLIFTVLDEGFWFRKA